jgi:ferric-dicitrate binding protein FerR (iron transport regulator)
MKPPRPRRGSDAEAARWLARLADPHFRREEFLRFVAWYQTPENHMAVQRVMLRQRRRAASEEAKEVVLPPEGRRHPTKEWRGRVTRVRRSKAPPRE